MSLQHFHLSIDLSMDKTGAPLLVGNEALEILNKWLDSEDIAKAWFGTDYKTFCDLTVAGVAAITRHENPLLSKIFTVHMADWPAVIQTSIEKAHNWWGSHPDGECCWLPLYRSLAEEAPEKYLKDVRAGISWVGTARSVPAARLDFWGLVVLGYANGGVPRVIREKATGSYRAIFDARNFTLVIWQNNLNATAVGHIAPKQYSSFDRNNLTQTEWLALLNTGSTVKAREDQLTSWIWQEIPKPPYQLLSKSWDARIQRTVIDHEIIKYMKERLRQNIYLGSAAWREVKFRYPDDLFIQSNAEMIGQNLLKSKVFGDLQTWNDFCQEIVSEEDVLHYSQKQLQLLSGEVERGNIKLSNLLGCHKTIFAFQKLLIMSNKVPPQLDTRGTETTILLAGALNESVDMTASA